ncbi:hypothetical protein EPD60_16600 [Flaviaesturariibacter flavus]|uniref:histidine kinase n=1 Tax=Flaviaesturariibacter flavus TaxID=2502780 RepID=A0A4R1B7E4_9BACT|nr:ATP-binding protein [Flaviaesturariibacter flavus]TCJ12165.1 hypothetical protein EPD60_16600 [Flaviaesturariibacter flavus]
MKQKKQLVGNKKKGPVAVKRGRWTKRAHRTPARIEAVGSMSVSQDRCEEQLADLLEQLRHQEDEKGRRAAELLLANKELLFQSYEKAQRAGELEIANAELERQGLLKERRAAELAAALDDLKAFAYITSHHLQEPLRKIRLFADRLLGTESAALSAKGREDLYRIERGAMRMSNMIQDIYRYARVNLHEQQPEEVEADKLVDQVLDGFAGRLDQAGARVVNELAITLPLAGEQFHEAFRQVIDNALTFSRPGIPPQIHISGTCNTGAGFGIAALTQDRGYFRISIQDNGIGFEPRFNERIFDVFRTLHSVGAYPGTGIGLAIVRRIMHRHGGLATADGLPNEGARFSLYFPMSWP